MASHVRIFVLAAGFLAAAHPAWGDDWPAWRGGATRSASTSEELPKTLTLRWTRDFRPNAPAWPEDVRLQFDAAYEPVVSGKRLFLASARNDSVSAIHTETGRTIWRTFVNGPVRFAPVVVKDRVYFGCDDGFLYCLDAGDGSQVWKLCPRPGRRILGNDRLSSVWPIRGGPVHVGGKLYLTAGVWPFEGTFLYAVDLSEARPGKTPPVEVTVLKDVSPQGYLAAAGDRLVVPNGRGRVVFLDPASGSRLGSGASSKGKSDWHAAVLGDWVCHGSRLYNWKTGVTLPVDAYRPVGSNPRFYSAKGGSIVGHDLTQIRLVEKRDRKGKLRKEPALAPAWTFKVPKASQPVGLHLLAGKRLFGNAGERIFSLNLPEEESGPAVSWEALVKGTPASMVAADGKLFVVTREGTIHCFGGEADFVRQEAVTEPLLLKPSNDEWGKRAESMLDGVAEREGFALVLGIDSGRLLKELVARTSYRLIAVEADAARVRNARTRLDREGLYGTRVAILEADPLEVRLPPYFANLVILGSTNGFPNARGEALVRRVVRSLRPYGGKAVLALSDEEHAAFARSERDGIELARADGTTTLSRVGALPGSADWTHEYSGPANSLMSRDKRVRTPLGLLWYGGPSADGSLYYDRHDWGPSMLVIEGRMFIQGPGKLTAVDVYTGRILWQNDIPRGRTEGRRGNFDAVGRHLLVVKDGLYVAYPKECLRLDPRTGKVVSRLTLEAEDEEFGRIRVAGAKLVTAVFKDVEGKGKLPVEIRSLDRTSGKTLWRARAEKSFPFAAVGGGKVFVFDGYIEGLYKDWKRKGRIPKAEAEKFVRALDLETGEESWSVTGDLVTTWLSYSRDHDVLLTSNKSGMVAYRGRNGSVLWSKEVEGKGFRGHPESVWDKVILRHDRVIDQRGPGTAYYIETGERVMTRHPVTGKSVPWEFTKIGHHCNYAIASEHLMTFRAQAAGYLDLNTGGTSRLEGFRSGCRNSLIPANGVLNAPNFAHGCRCDYSVFTSLAFIHTPENEKWSYTAYRTDSSRVRRVGINLGAPGNRRAENGTLWLNYPRPASPAPRVPVRLSAPSPRYFRVHATQIQGDELRWVAGSGVEGVERVEVTLGKKGQDGVRSTYGVRLVFAEPGPAQAGERVFDVSIQGEKKLVDFDVAREAGGSSKGVVREFRGIPVDGTLRIDLEAEKGRTLLCGIEVFEMEE